MSEELWGVRKILGRDFGDEAEVLRVLSRRFPGIGGTIVTGKSVLIAIRQEFSAPPGHAKTLFYKHSVIKKLCDYFHALGKYEYPHIPRPFGSATILRENGETREAYFYQWARGSEGFPCFYTDTDEKRMPVAFDEWNQFISCFYEAGVDLSYDCTVPDGEVFKNIVHEEPDGADGRSKFNCLWQRIDFGERSIIFKPDECAKFVRDSREKMIRAFGSSGLARYEMMKLMLRYLADGALDSYSAGQLEMLVRAYRESTMRDHVANVLGEHTDVPLVMCEEQGNGSVYDRR